MRITRTALIAGASVACVTALVVGATGFANAADSLPSKPSSSAERHGPKGPLFADLVASGTITQAQADAIRTALDAQRTADKAAHDKAEADALAALVAKGTITQAQADAIARADRGGVRDLVRAGTITRAQAQAIHDAMEALHDSRDGDRAAKMNAVLASLVAKGTITQAQADAITANAPKAGSRGEMGRDGKGRGHHGRGHDGQRGDRDDSGRQGTAPSMPTPSAS